MFQIILFLLKLRRYSLAVFNEYPWTSFLIFHRDSLKRYVYLFIHLTKIFQNIPQTNKRKANFSRNHSLIKNVTSTPETCSIFDPSLNNNVHGPSNQDLIPYRSQNIKHRPFSHKRGGNESVLIARRASIAVFREGRRNDEAEYRQGRNNSAAPFVAVNRDELTATTAYKWWRYG